MTDIKKLLESIDKIALDEGTMASAAKHPTGPKFGGYWKGTDPNPPKPGMGVGGSCEESDDKFLGKPYHRVDEEDDDYRYDSEGDERVRREKTGLDNPYEKCPACDGSGIESYVAGQGSTDCSQCGGKGYFTKDDEMDETYLSRMQGGSSYVGEDDEDKREECPACDGTGRDFHGEGNEACLRCGGKGHLKNGGYDDELDEDSWAGGEGPWGHGNAWSSGEGQFGHGETWSNKQDLWTGGGVTEGEQTPLTYEDVASAWKQVFPNSSVGVAKAFGGGYTFKFRLAKDASEVPNRILDNDPLNYTALLDIDGTFKEYGGSLYIKPPVGASLVYGRENLRRKTLKDATMDKLVKRFKQVHDFVAANADKLKDPMFDVNEKLGTTISEEEYDDDDIRNPNFKEELYDGCYVRDEQEGTSGEIFRMVGDPYDRRVRIEDRDGRGWFISPTRLIKVDDDDPEIREYFPRKGRGEEDDEDPDEYIGPSKRGTKKPSWQTDESLDEVEGDLSNLERNKALAAAKVGGADHEARGIWMQHYRRALSMGQNDKQARYYADQMTRSEPKFRKQETTFKEDVDARSLEEITEELKAAFEDYVSNEKYNDDTLYPPKSKKASVDKKKTKAPKLLKPNVLDEKGITKEDVEDFHAHHRAENVPQRERDKLAKKAWEEKWKREQEREKQEKETPVEEAKTASRARGILMKKLADIERMNPNKIKDIKDKFDTLTQKLSDVKSEIATKDSEGKVEEDFPTSLAPAGAKPNPNAPTTTQQTPVTATNPQPIAAQPQTTAQQRPVTYGTPTAAPGAGQPTPPAAGQAGGAPATPNAGIPHPPTGGQVSGATTPAEQMKGFINSISSNPAAAKQLSTKVNAVMR